MSTSKGNAGEHLAMAELLARGFDAYWADRGNPAYDITCFSPSRKASRLRVKTTSDGAAVWRQKKTGIFLDVGEQDDFVVICDIRNGVRGANLYVVPTRVVEQELVDVHKHYCSMLEDTASRAMEAPAFEFCTSLARIRRTTGLTATTRNSRHTERRGMH